MYFRSCMFLCLLISSAFSMPPSFAVENEVSVDTSIAQTQVAQDLRNSVSLALASHPKLKAAVQELYARVAKVEESESQFLPQLILSLGIGREHSDNTSTRAFLGDGDDQMSRTESSIFLRQRLFDGFQTHWQRTSDLELGQAQRFSVASEAENLAYEAVRVHTQVLRARSVLNDNLASLGTHQRIADDVELRASLGKDDRAKVGQINARLSLSLVNLEAAKEKLRAAEVEFASVVGSLSSDLLELNDYEPDIPSSLEKLLEEVVLNNPLLLAESRKLKSSQAEHKSTKSSNYPSLYLESGASWNDNLDGVRGYNHDAYIMLRMEYDLYTGGKDTAASKKASQNARKSAYQLQDLKRELALKAEQTWHHFQGLSRRIKFLQDYVDSSQHTKNAYIKQFEIGQRSLIDLLDAENELLKARRLYSEAKFDLTLARYRILSFQGGLLSHFSQAAPVSAKVVEYLEEKQ